MQEDSPRTNKARSEATRLALITAARKLFVTKGYAETGTPEIVSAAGVTRGALYHHFQGKADLFLAVVRDEAEKVQARIGREAARSDTPGAALAAGSDAFFAAMAAPGRVRLLLLDGPSVLGHATMNEIDRQTGGASLREGLAAVFRKSDEASLDALADVLSAAFDRAALAVSEGRDVEIYKTAVRQLLESVMRDA